MDLIVNSNFNVQEILMPRPLACLFLITLTVLLIWKYVRSKYRNVRALKQSVINKKHEEILSKYNLTCNGFLPLSCAERLPDYYNQWEAIASKLPELNRTRKVQEAIENMTLLSCKDLENEAMLRRAFIMLGMFVHSYVNGSSIPWEILQKNEEKENPIAQHDDANHRKNEITKLPPQLAIPWCNVCRKLDLPFVLTEALDLWNWRLKDPSKPIMLCNLTSLLSMTGTSLEVNFHMVPCAMQAVAGPFIPRLFSFHDIVSSSSLEGLVSFTNDVTNIFKEFRRIIAQIKHLVDKDLFYDVYRPMLAGFWPRGIDLDLCSELKSRKMDKQIACSGKDNVNIALDDQENSKNLEDIISPTKLSGFSNFENRNDSNGHTPRCNRVIIQRFANGNLRVNPKGSSAGQSTMFLLFDTLLGIRHWGTGEEFQTEVLGYMPPGHRQIAVDFGEIVSKHGSLRDVILQSRTGSGCDVVKAFNDCIQSVVAFRAAHLGISLKYLVRTKLGLGSSSFRDMLNDMLKGTKNALILDENNEK